MVESVVNYKSSVKGIQLYIKYGYLPHGRYPAAEASVLQSARARHRLPRWAVKKIQGRAEVQSKGM